MTENDPATGCYFGGMACIFVGHYSIPHFRQKFECTDRNPVLLFSVERDKEYSVSFGMQKFLPEVCYSKYSAQFY